VTCICIVFESLSDSPSDDNEEFELQLPPRKVEVFNVVPQDLSEDKYYVPLAANFPAINALTHRAALQYTIAETHLVKGVQVLGKLAKLFPFETVILVFVVPQSIAGDFRKQQILAKDGKGPKQKFAEVRQFVAGIPLGIDMSFAV
jgi:hypothetical protein